MTGFILGIVSSLAATMLTVAGGWIGARHARHWPVALLSRLAGLGIVRTYPRQRVAGPDLAEDLAKAMEISVFTSRGNELSRETFHHVWHGGAPRVRSIRVMLPDPDAGASSWLSAREDEMATFDPGATAGTLATQVRGNINYVSTLADKNSKIELRVYDLPHVARIILTDQVAYMTVYSAGKHGHDSPTLVFRNPGPFYDLAVRMFATAWEGGRDPRVAAVAGP